MLVVVVGIHGNSPKSLSVALSSLSAMVAELAAME